jgi:hypothetical protein
MLDRIEELVDPKTMTNGRTIASTVRRTRCTPAAYAPVAPRVPVRFAAGEA